MGPDGTSPGQRTMGVQGMKRILIALVLIVAMSAMASPPCWACSCVPSTKEEKAKAADVIFTGKVKKIEAKGETEIKVRFRVNKVYKGRTPRFTNVFTPDSGAACGMHFKEDTKYTVFAYWSDGKKYTSNCSGTKQGSINPDNYGLSEGYAPGD